MAKAKTQNHAPKKSELVADNTVLKLVIPAKLGQKTYQQVLNRAAKNVKIKGFRQGKVPVKLAEEQLDPAQLVEQAINQILPQAYADLVKKENKQPISDPSFQLISAEKDKAWEVEVQIAEAPTVKLTGYQKAASEARKKAEKAIADHLKEDAKAKKAGKDDGHDHHHHDDESTKLQAVFASLIQTLKPAIPELLIKQETQRQLEQIVTQLDQLKLKLDDYLKRRNQTFEQLTSELAAQSLANLQLEFILLELSKEIKAQATDQEIKTEVEKNFPDNKQQQTNPYLIAQIKRNIERKQVIDHLLSL
jgi:FKBP-type peptidyl-prolyl cis-trans isomerase (trigger factor)